MGKSELSEVSIAKALSEGAEILRKAAVPEPRREASSLLGHVLDKDRTFLMTHEDDPIASTFSEIFAAFLERRARGEPLQYITGQQEFFNLNFRVTPDVLIPRPETELLVEIALGLIQNGARILDVGTGSGCIAISILNARPNAQAVGLDVSEAAIRLAATNASVHNVSQRISFLVSDCFQPFNESLTRFDLIVSNPPYVAKKDFVGLQREVRDYEPAVALMGGSDGLSMVNRLLSEATAYLRPHAHLLFEIGFDQAARVKDLIDGRTWRLVEIQQDLQCIPRIVVLQKRP